MGTPAMVEKLIADIHGLGEEGVIVLAGPDDVLLDTMRKVAGKYHQIVLFHPWRTFDTDGDPRVHQVSDTEFGWMDTYHKEMINGHYLVLHHSPTVARDKDRFTRWLDAVADQRKLVVSNISTAVSLGRNFIQTYMENLPAMLRNPGVDAIKGLLSGIPAVLLGAGPSLERAADEIRSLKDRAVLIAVDAALPFCLDHHIYPDVIAGIDPLAENNRFYSICQPNRVDYLDHATLVCLVQYTADTIRQHPGPLFISDQPGNIIYQWLSPFFSSHGVILAFGGSVSHMVYALAEHLGCSPVIMIGQDLCFRERFHAIGIGEALHPEHVPTPAEYGAIPAIDALGDPCSTSATLQTFKIAFEHRLRETSIKTFNASALLGGMEIKGAHPMSLKDFRERYCDVLDLPRDDEIDTTDIAEINDISGAIRGKLFRSGHITAPAHPFERALADVYATAPVPEWHADALLHELTAAINLLEWIDRRAEYLARQTRKVGIWSAQKGKESATNELIRHIARQAETIAHPILNIIAMYHYSLELYLNRAAVRRVDGIEDHKEKIAAQVSRNVQFYAELREALANFIPCAKALRAELKKQKGGG